MIYPEGYDVSYPLGTYARKHFSNTLWYSIRLITILYIIGKIYYTPLKTGLEDAGMPRYIVTLTNDEIQELKALIQRQKQAQAVAGAGQTAAAQKEIL